MLFVNNSLIYFKEITAGKKGGKKELHTRGVTMSCALTEQSLPCDSSEHQQHCLQLERESLNLQYFFSKNTQTETQRHIHSCTCCRRR